MIIVYQIFADTQGGAALNNRGLSFTVVFFLVLAIVLILFGVRFGLYTLYYVEQISAGTVSHEELLESVQNTAFYAMIFGGMAVTGIGILCILFLHLFRKTARAQKEAEIYRTRSEALEELNRQTQTLAHHQRLQMLGTLTSSIAHEFNNLLTPIMGYSLMTLEKLPADETELYENILEVYNCSRQAKSIISRLSDLSRKNSDDAFHSVSPDELIQKTLDMALPAKSKKVDIKLDLNCLEQRITANEIQLSQLFLNLFLNAFQAMDGMDGELRIKSFFDERFVCIQVADTGCGIPDEIRERIFDPFFTTKENGRGTGLGLAIAAQVVEDHNGSITVDSKVDEGTSFLVKLPRA